jgi:1,4-dihydroxy-2-naphthoate octaprenyltransferase
MNLPVKNIKNYCTSSILPALAGTVLPFWLKPHNFTFKPFVAVEFLIAVILFHSGFIFFKSYFDEKHKSNLLVPAIILIVISVVIGFHINTHLPGITFIVFGITSLFAGFLYVFPPLKFRNRPGGEVVLSISLGMIPVLGAYFIQVGDLTRTVYLASFPLIASAGIWVWTENLNTGFEDENSGRKTLVTDLGVRFSSRYALIILLLLYTVTVIIAVISISLNSYVLISLISLLPFSKSAYALWNNCEDKTILLKLQKLAFYIHLTTSVIIILSSLTPLFI